MKLQNNTFISICLFSFILLGIPKAYAQSKVEPSCGCEALWKTDLAKEFTNDLLKVTQSAYPVWTNFNFGDGAIILNAGQTEAGQHCMGLWKKGRVIDYRCLNDAPRMLTQLYSYYLDYKSPITEQVPEVFNTIKEAPDFSAWMDSLDIETAVYMPVDFPNFPFKIPSMTKVQLAVHESFHIEVQLRKWYTGVGIWPNWDKQPKRSEVQNCYNNNEEVKSLIEQELSQLSLLIEALLDENKSEACTLGNQFLSTRNQRYAALKDIEITQYDESPGSCQLTEAIMEAEEGIADYASWTKLFEAGFVDRPALLKRYRAQQKDHFYLTGAMLMHAITLMRLGQIDDIVLEMTESESSETGSLTALFQEALTDYCK